ncbi:hypothetical protein PRJ_5645 (plasmid) [Pseudomonas sp. XWY-1]|nr:hypothetical protein PRJ_5645 [Pseudomonas sp. XWY-1]
MLVFFQATAHDPKRVILRDKLISPIAVIARIELSEAGLLE